MRGFFGVGVEGISKPQNAGAIMRTAHAFGASFFFAINPFVDFKGLRKSDTSDATGHMPMFTYPDVASLQLPEGCQLVGIELTDDAVELPSFRHPLRAAYILGPERGSLSPETVAACDFVVKIPTKFCVNVSVAGALAIYDRMICLGRFAERPVRPGGPLAPRAKHVHGAQIIRSKQKKG